MEKLRQEHILRRLTQLENIDEDHRRQQAIEYTEAGGLMRAWRQEIGVSLRKLAKALDISAPFLSDMELGRRRYSRKHVHAAAKELSR